MGLLNGKVAIVTGAAHGIGRGHALELAAQGASVVVNDLGGSVDGEGASRDADVTVELIRARGGTAIADYEDVADFDGAGRMVAHAVEAYGKLDILVNNAGITRDNLAMRMKDEDWDVVLRVNLEAAFRLMRAAAKPMMKARFGRIVSVTSVVAVTGNPGQANYVAAKAGLIGLSKAMAIELATRGITVNCIAPGFMTSAMTDALGDQQRDAILSRIPAGAMGSGEDIGAAAVYLASREAGYVTGQTLHVNGGMAMI